MKAQNGLKLAVDIIPDFRALHRFQLIFLTLCIYLGLLIAKRFLIPLFFTLLSIFIYFNWFIRMERELEFNSLYMAEEPYLLKIANYYDYFLFLLVSILFCWQVLILTRIHL